MPPRLGGPISNLWHQISAPWGKLSIPLFQPSGLIFHLASFYSSTLSRYMGTQIIDDATDELDGNKMTGGSGVVLHPHENRPYQPHSSPGPFILTGQIGNSKWINKKMQSQKPQSFSSLTFGYKWTFLKAKKMLEYYWTHQIKKRDCVNIGSVKQELWPIDAPLGRQLFDVEVTLHGNETQNLRGSP